ncbi:hypothetical protein BSL78_07103 [Apostichopus japonicus]|uniref:Uncharacterized protein n=1 Tax=Stichopus japonicus TaxID=307972 RepID=A0A2G8L799_STIJA|nr:hypothetical protein BSL78_07103 [Apostichopus japonicus]
MFNNPLHFPNDVLAQFYLLLSLNIAYADLKDVSKKLAEKTDGSAEGETENGQEAKEVNGEDGETAARRRLISLGEDSGQQANF